MAPPSATTTETYTNGDHKPSTKATLEVGLDEKQATKQESAQSVEMPKLLGPQKFTDKYEERHYLKGRLAAAFRIFGKFGLDDGVAGHITVRDPVDPSTFWVNPFGVSFSLMKRSDLIQVDHEGKVIDGGPCRLLNAAAFMIHGAIHKKRQDVLCAAHSHTVYGRAFCALGRKLDMITQDSCSFYNDHVLYENFNGIVIAEEEGKHIANALGDKKAALLGNHGLLTAGETVEATVMWFVALEKSCHSQLMADAAAGGRGHETVKISPEDAEYTYNTIGTPIAGWFSAKPMFDVIEKECGHEYLD